MKVIINSLLLSLALVSCGISEDSRYRSTAMLERPPVLPSSKQPGEQRVIDTSIIPKKREQSGLGADVYMVEARPMQLVIKKPFDYSWHALGLALKQNQIKIIDHEQDKGLYYVSYREKNLLENAVSLFKKDQENESRDANTVLKLKQEGEETKISIVPANPNEPVSNGFDEEDSSSDSEGLLWGLYETLRNNLKEE